MANKRGNGEGSIYQIKDGTWKGAISIGRDINGNIKRKTFSGKTRSEVNKKMKAYFADLEHGKVILNQNINLQDWFIFWLENYKVNNVKVGTIEMYHSLYKNYIKDKSIGITKLSKLKTSTLQVYYNQLIKDKITTVKRLKYLNNIIGSSLNQAISEEYLLKNPCTNVAFPKIEKKEIDIFTYKEQKQFIKSLEETKDRFKTLYKFALGTGLRRGEILALKWSDIDFDKREVSITKSLKYAGKNELSNIDKATFIMQTPKSESSIRKVPIPSNLIKELREYKVLQTKEKLKNAVVYQDKGYVFAKEDGRPIEGQYLQRYYKKALQNAGIEYRKFHITRHTYASRLIEKNVNLKVVQTLLGHSSLKMTSEIYAHVLPKQKIDAVELLNDCI